MGGSSVAAGAGPVVGFVGRAQYVECEVVADVLGDL
jgi:hypothetical protein